MVSEADLLFSVFIGVFFWVLVEHEPLIVALFLPIIKLGYRREPWTTRGSELVEEKIRAL